ncbi:DUF550 domain-containing protein [Salmonella enterica]
MWNACRNAILNGDTFRENSISSTNNFREIAETSTNSPIIPDEKGASLQLRNLIRHRHAEWSDATFGNVGPVGPLKHLSKEALEAAAEPDDISEWADMQFLLWDAQRRAGITDEQITLAMVEKLAVNKKREWPEPKDGEPRLHIKEQPVPVVPVVPEEITADGIIGMHECGFVEGWNACRAAMLQGVEQPQNARQNIPENIPDGNSPAIVMVPKEPTQAMIKAWLSEVANFRGHAAGYKAALAAAPQQEMK